MNELADKIARLPAWAREHIKRLEIRSEPLVEEAARARRELEEERARARRLSESNEALLELLRSAGRGSNDWAKTVVSVLESYEIFQSNNHSEPAEERS